MSFGEKMDIQANGYPSNFLNSCEDKFVNS